MLAFLSSDEDFLRQKNEAEFNQQRHIREEQRQLYVIRDLWKIRSKHQPASWRITGPAEIT